LNSAPFADLNSRLYFNKGAIKRIIPKYASAKVDWLNDSDVFTEHYIDNPACRISGFAGKALLDGRARTAGRARELIW
jgi:hypothetical protein